MVVNIHWKPMLEIKKGKKKNSGEEFDMFGEELEKKEAFDMFGEELEKKGEKMENTIGSRDLKIVSEPIAEEPELAKLGSLFRELDIDPAQILRRVYLEEVSKIEDAEQRNLSLLRCLDDDQQKEVSDELLTILKRKLQ